MEFHCGRAEELVPALVSRLASQQLVAILDPPRAGLSEWPPPQGLLRQKAAQGLAGPFLRGRWGPRLCGSPQTPRRSWPCAGQKTSGDCCMSPATRVGSHWATSWEAVRLGGAEARFTPAG